MLPLGEIEAKHIVTIEGLKNNDLTPIQAAIVEEGATQCGYCTPGIVLSLTGFFLNSRTLDAAIAALDGNLCRCTGYQSIKRAATRLCQTFSRPSEVNVVAWLVEKQILPAYFLQIPERLQKLSPAKVSHPSAVKVAGGTDLWVQKPAELSHANLVYLSRRADLRGIRVEQNRCYVGATTSIEDLKNSPIMSAFFPKMPEYFQRIAATPIRHRATVGGNLVNASPIGDLTIFFLALGAHIILSQSEMPLKDFFIGYKKLNMHKDELVKGVSFPRPAKNAVFNFEKVSKRPHLDIASVNSAMQIQIEQGVIQQVHLSAGGVAPIPLYLSRTVNYLKGKTLNIETIRQAAAIAQSEISPINDVRGSADYKRLLLRQLIYAHLGTCIK
ncbi:xanthine dehydrogenase, small subunit [Candidatus Thiomargarita nelsonii]|uniref:Xanthine dehydrogenase, small subunit n=1 Tax=Candidatus Thiomargarita nelsonii TaxID=1003181 RepID=A0A176S5Z1_9GAMM|nr:xanthine dehydrogenase, small subunit [Candidatus Thiomargarita nelsonii]